MTVRLKATDTAIPEADISYFLTKNIAIETICCVSPHEITQNGAKIGDTTLFAVGFVAIPLRHGQD